MIVAFMVPAPRVRVGSYHENRSWAYIIPRSNPCGSNPGETAVPGPAARPLPADPRPPGQAGAGPEALPDGRYGLRGRLQGLLDRLDPSLHLRPPGRGREGTHPQG